MHLKDFLSVTPKAFILITWQKQLPKVMLSCGCILQMEYGTQSSCCFIFYAQTKIT